MPVFLPHMNVSPSNGNGPTQEQEELWQGWELNPRHSGYNTASLPTELQGQAGAGRGN